MQYAQPFGNTNPNADYVNGNPATATPGSIIPAAAVEAPQREIVNCLDTQAGACSPDPAIIGQPYLAGHHQKIWRPHSAQHR